MGDSGAGQQQEDGGGFQGITSTLGVVLPMLGLMAGALRPETASGFNALAYGERQAEAQRNEAASNSATAEMLKGFDLQSDPRMSGAQQIGFANTQLTMAENKRRADLEAIQQAKLAQGEKTFGDIASVGGTRNGITEHPSDSASALYGLAPKVSNPEQRTAFKEKEGSIAEMAKRLSEAEAVARPFPKETQTFFDTPAVPPMQLESSPMFADASGVDLAGKDAKLADTSLSFPSLSLTQDADNVHALQRAVIKGKVVDDKNAADVAMQYGVEQEKLPGGRQAAMEARRQKAIAEKAETDAATSAAIAPSDIALKRQQAESAVANAPFDMEMKILQTEKLRAEVQEGKAPPLPGDLVAELRAMNVNPRAATGEQINAAITRHNARLTERAVAASRQQGVDAASIPARTPAAAQQTIESISLARAQMAEISRLASKVDLPNLVGGISPWINQFIQTGGKVGPLAVGSLGMAVTPEQSRFLALVQDYADSVLRLRSGAQINEQEFKRMLTFLMQPGVTADVFIARMNLQNDLLRVRGDILTDTLQQAGYRAPSITPPSLAPPSASAGPPKILNIEREPEGPTPPPSLAPKPAASAAPPSLPRRKPAGEDP